MAAVCKLVWTTYETDIDSFSLLDYTDGLDLAGGGWVPKVATDREDTLIEVLTLRVQSVSHNGLASIMQDLGDWKKRVQWSQDGIDVRRVWLRVALEDESQQRQALIVDLNYAFGNDLLAPPVSDQYTIPTLTLTIERMPYWEESEHHAFYPDNTDKTGINCIGGMATLSESISGDVPARVQWMRLYADGSANYSTYWIGFKTTRLSATIAHLIPVWSLKDGDLNILKTTTDTDSTAYSGTRVTCTINSTLTQMAVIETQDVIVTYQEEIAGSYLVLLRAKMSDTSTGRALIRYGWANAAGSALNNSVSRSRQVISGTSWKLYEMGIVTFPPDLQSFSLTNCAIALDAELLSGAGTLHADCLILIPISEGMVKLEAASNTGASSTTLEIAWVHPNGKVSGFIVNGSYSIPDAETQGATDVIVNNWSLPANGETPVMICAAQAIEGSTKGNTFTMSYAHVQRWRSLRGNDGVAPATT